MKIFEYMIRDLIMEKSSQFIDHRQHGFLPKKSCSTQMIPFTENLAFALNNSSRIDVIYFDFAKAFDSVSHDIILYKLKHQYGIDGLLLKFLKSYLQDRKQQVVIGGSISDTLPVKSGVPQGSILGPLLFVLFINDMHVCISPNTKMALYADDTKIWREIKHFSDHEQLQNDIDSLHQWSVLNRMRFHPDKCKVLVVTEKHIQYILPFDRYPYHLNQTALDYVNHEKDLWIIINDKLKWGTHCLNIISKANQRLGFVRRTCHFSKCTKQRRVLYLALVRSIFEYCSPVWHPHTLTHIEQFEALQKRAIKWILKEPFISYTDSDFLNKQRSLELMPMRYKFIITDLILFHNIVHETINIKLPEYIVKLTSLMVPSTRKNKAISQENDTTQYKCTILPKVDAFKYSFLSEQ